MIIATFVLPRRPRQRAVFTFASMATSSVSPALCAVVSDYLEWYPPASPLRLLQFVGNSARGKEAGGRLALTGAGILNTHTMNVITILRLQYSDPCHCGQWKSVQVPSSKGLSSQMTRRDPKRQFNIRFNKAKAHAVPQRPGLRSLDMLSGTPAARSSFMERICINSCMYSTNPISHVGVSRSWRACMTTNGRNTITIYYIRIYMCIYVYIYIYFHGGRGVPDWAKQHFLGRRLPPLRLVL